MHIVGGNSFILNIILLVAGFILVRQIMHMYSPIRGNGIQFIIAMIFLVLGLPLILNPAAHPTSMEEIIALVVGVVLSVPLIMTTDFEIREDGLLYSKKSMAFVISFLAVIAVRLGLRQYLIGMEPNTRMALFFLVAIGYVIPWRIIGFVKFRKVYKNKSKRGAGGKGGRKARAFIL